MSAAVLSRDELAALTQRYAGEVRAGLHPVEANADERWHVRLHQDECADVWLISWTTTQGTELHDHGRSGGAFTVVAGQLTESVWSDAGLADRIHGSGQTVTFGDQYVHDVRNTHEQTAVSVHAYSPPLSSMGFYEVADGVLVRRAQTWTDDPETPAPPAFASVDEMLEAARAGIARLSPAEALEAVEGGALIVDIRPSWQREVDGEVSGSVIVERNHLEWRLHPASDARLAQARAGQRWIVMCTEGYTSSLAAAALSALGIPAADIDGGIRGWAAAGLPVARSVTAVEQVVA